MQNFDALYSFSAKDIENLKEWGHNVIRLFVSWEAAEPERGQYNMTYINFVKRIVEICAKEEIYVILDAHQDSASPYFCGEGFPKWAIHLESFPHPQPWDLRRDENGIPLLEDCLTRGFWFYYFTDDNYFTFQNIYLNNNGIGEAFAQFWKTIAQNFKDYTNVIGYELLNEPYQGASGPGPVFKDMEVLFPFLSLIHISEPTRQAEISYAVFCLKKKKINP
eukprot:TRINITY_DN1700_c0_g2_i7.p1 TRINITY_DN1700_c0_g2~~TRINITY_DN1700_c0_g2_i7.p1  ORF type:complete len:221 (+),score=61.59 TRINITY_DN1700_c0_g2_i7:200-862(+)